MVALDLNITDATSITRIGTHVNRRYRKVLRRLGVEVFSRVEFDFTCTPSTQTQTVADNNDPVITRIINIFYEVDANTRPRKLEEITYDEMKAKVPTEDIPIYWAKKRLGSDTATFMIDSTIPDGLTLVLECEETKSTLSGSDVPNFFEEFHEILVIGAKIDELLKKDKPTLARVFKDEFDETLNELALKAVIGASMDIVQNKRASLRRTQRLLAPDAV